MAIGGKDSWSKLAELDADLDQFMRTLLKAATNLDLPLPVSLLTHELVDLVV